jgi:hypothetical protein
MRKHLALTAVVCLIASSASAQTTTATGTGISNSESNSGAVAIARGGNGGNGNTLTITNPPTPTETTSNINQRVSGTQTVKSAPSMVAPGLTAAGLETCLGSASAGVSAVGFGVTGGSTYSDEGCQARLDSRTLFAMGLKSAAVARLCQREAIYKSMPDICERYRPASVQAGVVLSTQGAGMIDVIDGKTGLTRPCANYDAAALKCRQWSGEAPIVIRRHKKVASLTPPTRSLEQAKAAKAKAKPADSPGSKAIESAMTPPKSAGPKPTETPAAPPAADSTPTTKEN